MSWRRSASAALAVVILLAGVLMTGAYFHLRRSIQPRSGEMALAGLGAPVTVSYDAWAVPAIEAADELDAARAQGFIHAGERLWQLEFFQRVARGRLAEIFGEPLLDTDRLLRTLDLWSAAGRELEQLDQAERTLLEAYAEGVNARLSSWRGPWPPEFLLLGVEPQAWSPQASLAIGRLMALDLSGWTTELSRIGTLAGLGSNRRAALGAGYPRWGPTILQDTLVAEASPPRLAAVAGRAPRERRPALRLGRPARPGAGASPRPGQDRLGPPDPIRFLSAFGLGASNAWALGGSRTADGYPLLANDMHLALRAPSTWFLNAIQSARGDQAVAGLSIPGTPGVIVGLNRHLAWAFTNAMVDDADFVVESVNLDGSMYRELEGWRPFEIREESIGVRGREAPDTWRVRHTTRGPVISDVVPTSGLTLSLLWTGLEPRGAAGALIDMNRARTAESFERAVRRFRSPHQNVIYATAAGELGYRMSGSVPLRRGANGALPISFEALPDGWPGFWPSDSMPALASPPSDYLASANNLQSWPAFGRVGVDYPAPFRARRIVDRISSASGWTVEDMRDLQLDSHSLWAERLAPRAAAAARRAGLDSLAAVLEAWDLRAEIESAGAAPFYVWLFRLRELIAADEFAAFGEGGVWFPDLAYIEILRDSTSAWVDDVRTPEIERLARLEQDAAHTAARFVHRSWGTVHLERSSHPLGRVPLLDRVLGFNVGPYPARGGRHTVRPDDPSLRSPLDSAAWALPSIGEYGPSQRFVAHLNPSDPRGYFLLPTGQAGNPLDPHYRDMSRVWDRSPLIELSPGRRPAAPRSTLRLVPEPR